MGYKVGDMVVYPRHGAAKVEAITERTVKGVTREYLQLSVLSSDGLVINVPVDNAKKVGVRDIVDANEVAKVFEILRTPIIEKEMNWSRRYKLNVIRPQAHSRAQFRIWRFKSAESLIRLHDGILHCNCKLRLTCGNQVNILNRSSRRLRGGLVPRIAEHRRESSANRIINSAGRTGCNGYKFRGSVYIHRRRLNTLPFASLGLRRRCRCCRAA